MIQTTPRPMWASHAILGGMPNGRRGYPRPPAHIEADMMAAGKADDPIALGLAHALYEAWLTDNGYRPDHPTGAHVPESVWND